MSALFNLFYLYDPWFLHFFRMGIFVGALAVLFLAYQFYKKQLIQGIVVPVDSIWVVLGLIIFSTVPLIINGTKDFSVVLMYCKLLILFGFGIVIYNLFYRIETADGKLMQDLKFGIIVQAVFGFLALCGIQIIIDFVLSTNVVLPRFYGSEQEYRLYNVTSSAFFQLSIFYLMLLHFVLAYNEKENTISSFYIFLILFIGVISGRTFFTFSVLSILLYFKLRYIPVLILFGGIVLALAKFYPEHPYVAHALEPVINILNGGESLSSSTDTLMNKHLFLPEIKQFIMGDGYYFTETRRYYGGTDSGFLRQILYGGALYSLVCFLFTAFFIRKIALNWFAGSWKFTLSALFILSVLNIKADAYAFPGIMMIFLMFLSLFGAQGKNIILFKQG